MKESVDYGLEVEKVSVAAESVDPSNPHEEGVLHWVKQTENYHNVSLNVTKG